MHYHFCINSWPCLEIKSTWITEQIGKLCHRFTTDDHWPAWTETSSQSWARVVEAGPAINKRCTIGHTRYCPSKSKTLIVCWIGAGPASQTMAQHRTNIGSAFRVLADPVYFPPCNIICSLSTRYMATVCLIWSIEHSIVTHTTL